MNELTNKHETAKQNSINFMRRGQISDYFNALLEMNKYRRLLSAIIAYCLWTGSLFNMPITPEEYLPMKIVECFSVFLGIALYIQAYSTYKDNKAYEQRDLVSSVPSIDASDLEAL